MVRILVKISVTGNRNFFGGGKKTVTGNRNCFLTITMVLPKVTMVIPVVGSSVEMKRFCTASCIIALLYTIKWKILNVVCLGLCM